MGFELRRRWQDLADRHGLNISHNGLAALTGFAFQSPDSLAYKTLIARDAEEGVLSGNQLLCVFGS